MSDVSMGPGWWIASDGRWYPPHLHPSHNPSRHTEPGQVTGLHPGPRLPPRDIQPPTKTITGLVLARFLPALLVSAVVVLGLNHSSSGLIGVLGGVAGTAVILGIELPLIIRGKRRNQEARLRSLPPGGLFSGRARTISNVRGRRRVVEGDILVDASGILFTPKKVTSMPPLTVPWESVSSLKLSPSRQPLVGSLVLTLSDHTTRTVLVSNFGYLADILAKSP